MCSPECQSMFFIAFEIKPSQPNSINFTNSKCMIYHFGQMVHMLQLFEEVITRYAVGIHIPLLISSSTISSSSVIISPKSTALSSEILPSNIK